MFGTAGDKNASFTDNAGDEARDCAPNVPLCVDVDIVKHGVAMPTYLAAAIGLAFHQHAGNPAGGGGCDLRARFDAEIGQHVHDRADIQRVAHRTMGDTKRSVSGGTVAELDHIVTFDLDTGS